MPSVSEALLNDEEELLCLWLLKRRGAPLNRWRQREGEFAVLVRQMRDWDEEMYFTYFGMSPSNFDDLVHRLSPFISQQGARRTPISLPLRSAVTIRLLASGES